MRDRCLTEWTEYVVNKNLDKVTKETNSVLMNEPYSENTPLEAASAPDFKNRSTGLTVFGILTILMGCVAGLMTLMMLAVTVAGVKSPNASPTPASDFLLREPPREGDV